MTRSSLAIRIILAVFAGFCMVLLLVVEQTKSWQHVAGALGLLFLLVTLFVGPLMKERARRAREEQPIPTASIVDERPRERDKDLA